MRALTHTKHGSLALALALAPFAQELAPSAQRSARSNDSSAEVTDRSAADSVRSAQDSIRSAQVRETCSVVEVVDGDTLRVLRRGVLEKLRLSCVDTEEKLSGRATSDPDKPQTVFGEECALWAKRFFAELAVDDHAAQVALEFSGGFEERDVYGRLLCHVILPDGRDFNLLLVELGKSPYFNKYGNCLEHHEAFVAAQRHAREAQLGIWNPATNVPKTPGAPSARRDYDKLLPWWNARAQAVDLYRAARAKDPEHVASADRPDELEEVAANCAHGERARVFGTIDRLFDEKDGSLTVLLRTGAKDHAVRVRIPNSARETYAPLELDRRSRPFRQNYLWIIGSLARGERGYHIDSSSPDAWQTAGPDPAK